MGSRKKNKAEQLKEERKNVSFATLRNCPTSPRKMRLMADLVRGMNVEQALHVLKHSPQDASGRLHKLLLSTLANWQAKNEGVRMESANLYISEIGVDGARSLKRIRTAPQGRAHRIRKRSNHVTLRIDNREIAE
ncbi:MAG: 50S ribosomal protein L22 [Lentimicrobium sp.]|jgi:large subunit ribosomal protein L22|nr:50S ribosomal protein L22 [Lentimicrobium sp.]